MDEKAPETALVPAQADLQVALRGAVSLWASATTSESERRSDLLRDKQRIVLSFFRQTGKIPSEVEPADVQDWLWDLGEKGISAGAQNPEHAVHYLAGVTPRAAPAILAAWQRRDERLDKCPLFIG